MAETDERGVGQEAIQGSARFHRVLQGSAGFSSTGFYRVLQGSRGSPGSTGFSWFTRFYRVRVVHPVLQGSPGSPGSTGFAWFTRFYRVRLVHQVLRGSRVHGVHLAEPTNLAEP